MKFLFAFFTFSLLFFVSTANIHAQTATPDPTVTPSLTDTPTPTTTPTPSPTTAPTNTPTTAPTATSIPQTPTPTQSATPTPTSKKAVLGAATKLGSTGSDTDITKLAVAFIAGIVVFLFGFKLTRTHEQEE